MGRVQKNNKREIWELLLHMRDWPIDWEELAHGSHVAKGECGCIIEIRFTNPKAPMLQLQYKSWGKRCGFLQENVKGNRTRKNGGTRKRQTKDSECYGSLSEFIRRI